MICRANQLTGFYMMRTLAVNDLNRSYFGVAADAYFLSADEVIGSSNWEQLGIVERYVKSSIPVEKLLEYVKCENIRGNTMHN